LGAAVLVRVADRRVPERAALLDGFPRAGTVTRADTSESTSAYCGHWRAGTATSRGTAT